MPYWSGGVVGLRDEALTKTFWNVHAESGSVQVRLKSSDGDPSGQTSIERGAPVDRRARAAGRRRDEHAALLRRARPASPGDTRFRREAPLRRLGAGAG